MTKSRSSNGRVRHMHGHRLHWNQALSPSIYGFTSIGDEIDALSNGLICGFDIGDFFFKQDTTSGIVLCQKVAATLIATLATPVDYIHQRMPLRVRVGATTAGGVPATTGIYSYTAQNLYSQGVLRCALADKDDCSQVTVDQGGIFPVDNAQSWIASFAISYINLSGTDPTTAANTFFEIGLGDTAASLDPAVAIATNHIAFKVIGSQLIFKSQAGNIGVTTTPTTEFVLTLEYSHVTRTVIAFLNDTQLGTYTVAAAVTKYGLVARTSHLTAYTALADAPLTVDIDSILINHTVTN